MLDEALRHATAFPSPVKTTQGHEGMDMASLLESLLSA
jgi:hypothetical protein